MKLTKLQRLRLCNQYKILAALSDDDGAGSDSQHYNQMIEALEQGYTTVYERAFDFFSDDVDDAKQEYVVDVLRMFRALNVCAAKHDPDGKLAANPNSRFIGFDGNEETDEYAFCRYVLFTLGDYADVAETLPNGESNSHAPTADRYEAMLRKWRQTAKTRSLTLDEALAICNTRQRE